MKIVALSGPSCSGKSTLARHLRHILPHAGILYEDDFYRDEKDLPLDDAGRPNWDCPESFDLNQMREKLEETKQSEILPDQETREEHNNNSNSYLVSDSQIEELRSLCTAVKEPILLVDGILLFHRGNEVSDLFDLKVVFPFTYSELKRRRESRTGYATSEGFWTDPPNYFDDLVWPEFVKHSQHLYASNDNNYTELSQEAKDAGIYMPKSTDMYQTIREVLAELK